MAILFNLVQSLLITGLVATSKHRIRLFLEGGGQTDGHREG